MAEHLLISQSSFLCRVALVSDNRLIEYREEHRHVEPVVGALYKGKVVRSLDALEAVSVDYGAEAPGFLPLDELTPESTFSAIAPNTLKPGQELLVQVTKGPRGDKGARLSGKFSFPGRYCVYLPCAEPEVRVARRLGDTNTRQRLKEAFNSMLNERGALLLRSVAPLEAPERLLPELTDLRALWASIWAEAPTARVGQRLHHDHLLPLRAMREQVSTTCTEIMVDDVVVADKLNAAIDRLYPDLRGKVMVASDTTSLFGQRGVEAQLNQAAQRKVSLPSGGSLIFDETEAMVVVDVNAGNPDMGTSREDAHLRINLEAARETALQLRLRDLRGIIVVDFINLRSHDGIKKVEDSLREALNRDPVRTDVSSMSRLGLVQIMRSEGRRDVRVRSIEPCAHCHGRGHVPTGLAEATRVLHQLERLFAQQQVEVVEVRGPISVVEVLSKELGATVEALSAKHHKRIVLSPSEDYHSGECVLYAKTSDDDPINEG